MMNHIDLSGDTRKGHGIHARQAIPQYKYNYREEVCQVNAFDTL